MCLGVEHVTNKLLEKYRGFSKYIVDFCDPYQGSQSDWLTGTNTMIEVENKYYKLNQKRLRFFTVPRIKIYDRLEITGAVIRQGIEVDESCVNLVKGFRGAYVMKPRDEKPIKDGWYEHIMDAKDYPIIALFRIELNEELVYMPENLLPIEPDSMFEGEQDDVIEGVNFIEHSVSM